MTNEEKILSYLDGSLSDSESAELLHSLSVSPEKRVVLEQHIQLRQIASAAQKPFTVPDALEQDIASKIPVIARFNREVATGIIASSAIRQNILIRGAVAVGSFFVRYPVQVSATALIVAALGSYLFFERSTNTDNVPAKDLVSAQSTSSSSKMPGQVTQNETASPANKDEVSSRISSSRNTQHSSSAGSTNTSLVMKDRSSVSSTPLKREIDKSSKVVNTATSSGDLPASTDNVTDRAIALADINFINSFRTDNSRLNNNIGEPRKMNPFGVHKESLNLPLLLRLDGLFGQSYFRVKEADASTTAQVDKGVLLGLDYIISEYFSFGVEGGTEGLSHVVPQTTVDQSGGVSRVISTNVVESSNRFYGKALIRFTPNPYDMIHLEASAGGGMAFADNGIPMVGGSLLAGYSLSESLGVSFGIVFSGTFAKTSASSIQSTNTFASDLPIGYVQGSTSASSFFAPSVSVRAGLRIKPW